MVGQNRKSNRLYWFIAGYALVLSLLAVLGYVGIKQLQQAQEEKNRAAYQDLSSVPSNKAFYRLPRMDLTLSSLEGETHHARIGISLEIDKKNLERFADFQPRVSDRIVNFLRQLDVEEMRKPTFTYHLHRDLLQQINDASGPVHVTDIVFREFVVR